MTDTRTHVSTVHHVSFRVDDLEESLKFYQEVLGCKLQPRPDIPGPRGAWLKAGSTQVHLSERPADDISGYPPTEILPYACHVAFHTDNLDDVEASLRERNMIYTRGDVVDQIFTRDPSGNLIEFSPY